MAWPLSDYRAISMDCYGTLIDWEAGIWEAFQPMLDANEEPPNRRETLEAFAELEAAQEAATPTMLYPDILRHVHAGFADRFGLDATETQHDTFGESVQNWPAFPDATEALRRLQQHYKLVILSNVDRTSFAASNEKLDVEFDVIYTAEDVGAYKPADANFTYLLTELGELGYSPSTDILHVAQSLFHDHGPAERFGIDRVWIDRQRLSNGGDWGATARLDHTPSVDFTYFTMAEFADAVDESSRRDI
jgi:2-haloacid dehalogenase